MMILLKQNVGLFMKIENEGVNMKCYNCGSADTYVKDFKNDFTIKGKDISFTSKRRFCHDCGKIVYDECLDNRTSELAIEMFNNKYGVSKEKLIELRKKYNLSQADFSKIIGCAKKTLISYEKGKSIPNDVYMVSIKNLINNPEAINEYLVASKERISTNEYIKIDEKIKAFKGNNIKKMINEEENNDNNLSQYNGFTPLSIEKIKNVILFLASDTMPKTKLLKEMFYSDFYNYKNTTTSITGLEYVKLPYGPVPDDFDTIINLLYKENLIDYKIKYINDESECHLIKSKKEFDKGIFDNEELEILEKIKTYFKNYTTREIVEKSHQEKAYLKTKEKKKIDYEYAFDIEL